MEHAIDALHAGTPLIVDGALGAGLAAQVLHETKVLLASGGLVADGTFADAALALAARLRGTAPPPSISAALYASNPALYDSLRLVRWLGADSPPGLRAATAALGALVTSIGAAERQLRRPLSPAWPPDGLALDPQGALLAAMPGNSTRYGLHTDSGARHARKLTLLYYPAPWTPAAGGELRVWATGNATTEPPTSVIAPLADRLVLFHSELAHEVAVTRMPRISLTVWGFGHATRRAPPPSTLDLAPRCTSDYCQKAQRRRENEAFAAGLRIGYGSKHLLTYIICRRFYIGTARRRFHLNPR